MLSGTVDYAAGQTVAGWVRGPIASDVAVTASIDGTLIAAACTHHPEFEGMIAFTLLLPRAISAGELTGRQVLIKARNASHSVELPCSQPIEAAAAIDNMTADMIGRMAAFLSTRSAAALTSALSQPAIAPPARKGNGIDPGVLDDLMRWS